MKTGLTAAFEAEMAAATRLMQAGISMFARLPIEHEMAALITQDGA